MVRLKQGENGIDGESLSIFTFHYGKFKTERFTDDELKIIIFTFHYGKIKTTLQLVSMLIYVDLHSTMVRLKQKATKRKAYCEIYLHSTMVRLKRVVCFNLYTRIQIYIPLW